MSGFALRPESEGFLHLRTNVGASASAAAAPGMVLDGCRKGPGGSGRLYGGLALLRLVATRLQRLRRGGLSEAFLFAGPGFRRAAPWLLAAVALLGLATRLHPTLRHGVWGSDSGEYLYLTDQLVRTGRVLFEYDGWGIAYPYFPGMFVVSGAVHSVLGVGLELAVLWTTPILAATIPLLAGLLAYRVTSDPRVGVVSAAFLAATGAVVITTSHAMPGTLGQVLLLALLAFLPDAYRDKWHFALFAPLVLALLWTHHLTTYFAAGIVAFIPFYREMTQRATDVPRLRVEAPLAALLVAGALWWWLGVATPFREEIVGDALPFHPAVTALLFLLAMASLPLLVWLKRQRTSWYHAPRYPSFPQQRFRVLACFFGVVAIVLLLVNVKVPGTDIKLHWATFWYSLPVLAFVSFLPLGIAAIRFFKHGTLVLGWLYALLASLVFAILIGSKVLFPFRHVDYLVMAMAPLVAVGMLMVYDQTLASRIPAERPRARANLVAVLIGLLLVSAFLSLPPRETLGGFEEGIGHNEVAMVEWIADHPDIIRPGSTIAADHRVSSLLWGLAGLHATWDYTPRTYHAETPEEALEELAAAHVPARRGPARVDFVLLSPQIVEGVTLVQWENSDPMSEAAIRKFDDARFFEPVHEQDGVKVWRVRWEALGPAAPEPVGVPG